MKAAERGGGTIPFVLLAFAIVAMFAVSLATLGSFGLMDPDEPRYAGSASEMLTRGEWWIPYFNDQVRIVKPILFYWEILVSYTVFGEGEFAARLPSWIAGLATLLLTMRLGWRLAGRRTSLLTGAAFALCPMSIGMSRLSTPDASLGAAVCAAMLAFVEMRGRIVERWDDESRGRRRAPWWLAIGFAVALAVGFLIKGPVAILLPGLTIAVFLGLRREWTIVPAMRPLLVLVIFLVLAVPWFVVVALRPEMGGARVFFDETIGRYFGSDSIHPKPFWFFVPVVLAGMFPWSLDALHGLVRRISRGGREPGGASGDADPYAVGSFALCWASVVLVFFSLSPNKLPSYMMPIAPAVALLAARGTWTIVQCGASARTRIAVEGGLWVVLGGAALAFVATRYPDAGRASIPLASGGLGFGVVGLLVAWRARSVADGLLATRWIAVRAVGLAFGFSIGLVVVTPSVEIERSYRVLEEVLAPRVRDGDLLVEGWFHQPGYVYYSGQPVVRLDSVDDIVNNMEGPRRVFVLLDEVDYERVASALSFDALVLHRAWGRVLFTNTGSSDRPQSQ